MANAERERTPLDKERDALVSLAAWSAGQEHLQTVDVETALHDLAELTESRQRQSPRLVVLERLVRAATRRGGEVLGAENAGGRQRLLGSLIDAVPDDTDRIPNRDTELINLHRSADEYVDDLERALDGHANAIPADAYETFAADARIPLALHPHERVVPACDDSKKSEPVGGLAAHAVTAMFFSDRPFTDFERWLDPTVWPALCPWFFRGMDPLTAGPVQIPPQANDHLGGWWQAFDERVLLVANEEWTTCLFFSHLRRASELRTSYRLAQPDDASGHFTPSASGAPVPPHALHLSVDKGFLLAADVQDIKPPPTKTQLSLTKIAKFVDPEYDEWTTLLCDTFWLDLAMSMADAAATSEP